MSPGAIYCDWCGKPIGNEIIESFTVDGRFCSDACCHEAETRP